MNKNKSQDSYEKIFEELEKIVQKMDSGDISLEKSLDFFEKGMKLIKEGKEKLDQALKMIILAAEKSPDSYHIIDSLGWAYYKKGDFGKALLYLEKAMEIESTDPIVNDHLGDVLWMLGRKREAKFQWKKSLSFNPESVDKKNTEDKLKFGLNVR